MVSGKRWRFSSRGLLLLTAVLAVYCAFTFRTWHRHKAAVDAIQRHGGTYAVKYDGPEWLRKRIGRDRASGREEYFYNLTRVNFGSGSHGRETYAMFDDETLATMIRHFNAFSKFHILDLSSTGVSDDGLRSLLDIHYIDELQLHSMMNVSDAGLRYVAQLKDLKHIDLSRTSVTPSGVAKLQLELPKCRITGP